jgi:hypothetical protein
LPTTDDRFGKDNSPLWNTRNCEFATFSKSGLTPAEKVAKAETAERLKTTRKLLDGLYTATKVRISGALPGQAAGMLGRLQDWCRWLIDTGDPETVRVRTAQMSTLKAQSEQLAKEAKNDKASQISATEETKQIREPPTTRSRASSLTVSDSKAPSSQAPYPPSQKSFDNEARLKCAPLDFECDLKNLQRCLQFMRKLNREMVTAIEGRRPKYQLSQPTNWTSFPTFYMTGLKTVKNDWSWKKRMMMMMKTSKESLGPLPIGILSFTVVGVVSSLCC